MNRSRSTPCLLLIAAIFSAMTFAAPSFAKQDGTEEAARSPEIKVNRDSVASRIQNVERLVNVSSGAQQVMSSDNPEAIAQREEALARLEQAKELFEKRKYKESDELLSQTTGLMFGAVRSVGSGSISIDKKHEDFEARAESVRALLGALERIGKEKGATAKTTKITNQINAKVEQARAQLDDGMIDEGRKTLDEGYEIAKLSIEDLRGGDTLVRTLKFETDEEEYLYEVDRNDTHQILMTVLLKDKPQSPSVKEMVDRYSARAKELRSEADAKAEAGDYRGAIESLELSTQELVRAIRSSGVYIPG